MDFEKCATTSTAVGLSFLVGTDAHRACVIESESFLAHSVASSISRFTSATEIPFIFATFRRAFLAIRLFIEPHFFESIHPFNIWHFQINNIIFGITKYVNVFIRYNFDRGDCMKKRILPLGDRNMIGARVTIARKNLAMKQIELLSKLQTAGVDISVPALSLLEGQKRPVSDVELNALANILNVSVDWLLGRE